MMNFEDKLIYTVEQNPIIYDKSSASYKNSSARDIAWKSVAKKLKSQDVDYLKKRWRTLRDAFIKKHRQVKCADNEASGEKKKKWRYYDSMLFLVPHIESKEATGSHSQKNVNESQGSPLEIQLGDDYKMDQGGVQDEEFENRDDSPVLEYLDTDDLSYDMVDELSPTPSVEDTLTSETIQSIRNKKMLRNVTIDNKLIAALSKKEDPDEQFLLSCAPALRRLPPQKNMMARIEIQKVLYRLEFDDTDDCSARSNQGSSSSAPFTQGTLQKDENS